MHALNRAAAVLGAGALLAGCGDGGSGNPLAHDLGASLDGAGRVAGVNLDVSRRLPAAALGDLVDAGVAWIALIPVGWQPRFDVPEVALRTTGVPWGQTDAGLRELVARVREHGLRALVKPHVKLVAEVPGQWRGTIGFDVEADWLAWERDYRELVLHYARLAQDTGADMFSVGVELHRVVRERPAFWRDLIDRVRRVYAGPLTYGANWDQEVTDVGFWGRLDFIGVSAYFPLTRRLDATVAELVDGWQEHLRLLASLCDAHDRRVLFTEVGYRSIAGAGVEPWNFAVARPANAQEQADAYEALFRVFWEREWFAGVFLWEWDAGIRPGGRAADADGYSPQNKPAEAVMRRWFSGRG